MHLGGRANDIDFDVWPVLGLAQPAQHPRVLEEERRNRCQSRVTSEGSMAVGKELTMSVFPTSLVVAMRSSEKEGSAVLSMRTMAVLA